MRPCEGLGALSVSISVVLLLVYGLFLVFSLLTHSALFAGTPVPETTEAHEPAWSPAVPPRCLPQPR